MAARRGVARSLFVLAAFASLAACSSTSYQAPLTFRKNVQLPADTARPSVDLLNLDPRRNRLYLPPSSTNSLDLGCLSSGRLRGSVPGRSRARATSRVPASA